MKRLKSFAVPLPVTGLFVAVSLTFSACSSTPKQSAAPAATAPVQIDTGGEMQIETITVTATVASIDYTTRQIVLRRIDGTLVSCRVGPQAVNFDKIRVGDEIRATLAEKWVTFISKDGAKSGVDAASLVVRVLVNGVPSGMAVNNMDLSVKVLDVDLDSRRILLEISRDDVESLRVAPAVSLANIHDGDQILVRVSDAVAITVERP